MNAEATPQYWFNTQTKQVEQGHVSSWEHLMGPYATRGEAQRALETAKERTEHWDSDDDRWDDAEWDEEER